MNAAVLVAHLLSILHGVAASVACAACFYVCGLALVPRRWERSLGDGEAPGFVGAALYVLVCWFGITFSVPLTRIGIGFAGAVAMLLVVRHRRLAAGLKTHVGSATAGWLLAFGALYVLAYLFTTPPASAEYLPVTWLDNIDLLMYARYTKYLQLLGPLNLAGFAFLNRSEYFQTPAAFHLLGWLSLFFGQDPLRATMPAEFAFTALIGLMAARVSRSVFALSRTAALAIACILISGPFFRYVAGNYFLSTLMATPVLLYLLWQTAVRRPQRRFDAALAIGFGSAYVLLLFIYPVLLVAGLAAQLAAVGLRFIADAWTTVDVSAWRNAARQAGRTIAVMLVPLGLVAAGLYQRVTSSIDMVRVLSRRGIAGWPLDIISPLAILGVPGTTIDPVHIQVQDPAGRIWAAGAFCAIAVALAVLYFGPLRRQTTAAQQTLVGLACGSFLMYSAYYWLVGPSYQQWKLASYSALPLSFVVCAGTLHLLLQSRIFARDSAAFMPRWIGRKLFAVVALAAVGGNLLVHAENDPALTRVSGSLRNIADVNDLPFFRELSVQMTDDPWNISTWLALYFLPSKRVNVISSRFRPNTPLSFAEVSRQHPLLIQDYGCEGVGHAETMDVPKVGCLLLAPPSLALGTVYPFNRSFLFVEFEGLSGREEAGRWNNRSTVQLKLTADLRRTWVLEDTYINLRLSPYMLEEAARQQIALSWGAGRHANVSLAGREWISLPAQPGDWTGERVVTLPITLEFRDGAGSLGGAPAAAVDRGPLAVMFQELSVSVSPQGQPLAPIVQ